MIGRPVPTLSDADVRRGLVLFLSLVILAAGVLIEFGAGWAFIVPGAVLVAASLGLSFRRGKP
jgi:hypothetical protein